MLEKSIKSIPKEYQFQYLSAYRNLMKVRKELKDFMPQNKEDEDKLKILLKDYKHYFRVISDLNAKMKTKQIKEI